MKKLLMMTAVCCISFSGFTQPLVPELWANRAAGTCDLSDRYNKIIADGFGNFVAVGYTERSGNYKDFLIVKLDANGDTIWTRTKSNGADDEATAVAIDQLGYIYVTGYVDGGNTKNDIALVKYDTGGTKMWDVSFNRTDSAFLDDFPVAIAVDPSGDIVITGYCGEGTWAVNDDDIVTLKYNSSGALIWDEFYDGFGNGKDQAAGMAIDTAGNIFITGRTFSGANDDWRTIKYDVNGNKLWSQLYANGGGGDDRPAAIALDALGNPVVTGRVDNGVNDDYRTIKYNAVAGNVLWSTALVGAVDNDRPDAITIDDAGNVYVTGHSAQNQIAPKNYDILTVKYNASGVQQWRRTWGAPPQTDDQPVSIKVDAAGNIYIGGTTDGNAQSSLTTNLNFITLKYDVNANLIYARTLDGTSSEDDPVGDMVLDPSGFPIVVGRVTNLVTQKDAGAVMYNGTGDTLWTKFYNGEGDCNESGHDISMDAVNGDSYVAGYTFANQNNRDAFIMKIDAAGNTMWTDTFQGAKGDDDEFDAVAYDANGFVYACGYTKVSGEKSDYLTAKFNANGGDTVWTRTWGDTVAHQSDRAVSLVVDAAGNVYVTGFSDTLLTNDTLDDRNIVTIKYDAGGTMQWWRSYDGTGNALDASRDEPVKIIFDHAGNLIVAGRAENVHDDDFVLLKYDSATGNTLSGFPVVLDNGSTNDDRATDVLVDNSDNIYVAGYSQAGGTSVDEFYMIAKYSSGGLIQWKTFYDGPAQYQPDRANAMAIDGSGNNIILTGQIDVDPDNLVSNYDYQTVGFFSSGAPMPSWLTPPVGQYNGAANNDDVPVAISIDGAGNIYVTGQAGEGTTLAKNNNIHTIAYNDTGAVRFYADYDGTGGSDAANAMVLLSPAIFITGSSDGLGNAQKDIITLKYDVSVGIKSVDNNKSANISVQPNPFAASAVVHINPIFAASKNLSAIIYDVLGNEVMAVNSIHASSFFIYKNNLAAGVYILKLFDGVSSVANQKLIVE